ncbi:MAG: hypothetical protein JSU72_17200 [Deltaproteobacteria bacterium]|nr:MAG: hypothetical protein JSU72_17200 [Deltaproteobacteria bacterium]
MTKKRNTTDTFKNKDRRLKELRESFEKLIEEFPDDADRFKRYHKELETEISKLIARNATDEEIDAVKFDLMMKHMAGTVKLGKDLPPVLADARQRFDAATLAVYAQVYYKIIEVVSTSPVAYADFPLNQHYLYVVKQIRNILSLGEMKDFTGEFDPPEHILPSSCLREVGWEDGAGPPTENFLASVQTFLNELDMSNDDAAALALFTKWLHKRSEPALVAIEKYRLKAKKYFDNLMKNLKREQEETEKAAKDKEQTKPCTEKEYKRLTLIHGRLRDLMRLLRRSDKDVEEIEYRQIELDEDVTEFWPTIETIGQRVGINVSGKLDVLKEIIFVKEITPLLGANFDEYADEIELAEMVREGLERTEKLRVDLIQDLYRIMVRLAKRFGVNKKIELEPSFKKPAETVQDDESSKGTDNSFTKAERLAYRSYEYAISEDSRLAGATDDAVYDWLKENGTGEVDYDLPRCDTWKRQVRAGRKYHGTQKNTPRAGRERRSTIRSNQINSLSEISSQYNDKAD